MTHNTPISSPRRRRIFAVAALILSLGMQAGAIFLAAGYHAACGRADAAGHLLGFNDPIRLSHLGVMADSLNASAILSETNFLGGLPGLITLAALVGAWWFPVNRTWVRCFARQSVLFVAICLGALLRDVIHGHSWTGECIVEGELSVAMSALLWIAAWIPVLGWEFVRWLKKFVALSRRTPIAKFPA